MAERQFDLTRDMLAVVFLFALIAASVWILLPFLGAVVWATMIVVATWPMLLTLQRWLLGRRWLAVTGMTLLLLAIFILPLSFAIVAVADNFKEITAWTTSLANFKLPPPPDWLGKIPLVGTRVTSSWQQLAALSHEELAARFSPYLGGIVRWLAGQIGDLFESCFKRDSGIKDSGRLLPQYGGILDLVDSPMFAMPVAWFLLTVVWGVV